PRSLFFASRRPPAPPLFPYTTLFRSPQWRFNAGRVETRGFLTRTTSTFAAGGTLFGFGTGNNPPAPPTDFVLSAAASIAAMTPEDRKSTRLNSSHVKISYAVFCLKKK